MSQAGLINTSGVSVPDATEVVKGKARLATTAEAVAGVNDTTIITPLKLNQVLSSASKYSLKDPDGTSGWTGPAGGFYSRSITQVTHNKGTLPSVEVYSYDGAVSTLVAVDTLEFNAAGDVTIKVSDAPDGRFRAHIVIS